MVGPCLHQCEFKLWSQDLFVDQPSKCEVNFRLVIKMVGSCSDPTCSSRFSNRRFEFVCLKRCFICPSIRNKSISESCCMAIRIGRASANLSRSEKFSKTQSCNCKQN